MNRPLKIALSLAVSGAGLWWVLRGVDGPALWSALRGMRSPALLAVVPLAMGVEFLLRARRWCVLLPSGALEGKRAFAVTAGGFFLNNILPLRAGEAARLLWTCRDAGLSVPAVGAVLVVDRVMDMLALATLGLLAASGFPSLRHAGLSLGAGALCAAAVLWGLARRPDAALALAARAGLPAKLQSWMAEVARGSAPLARPTVFVGLYVLSLAFWSMNIGALSLLSGMFGLNLSWLLAAALMLSFAFGAALPSAPGYVGTMEAAGVAFLSAAGHAPSQSLPFILTLHLAQILSTALYGLPSLAFLGKGKPDAAGEKTR